MILQSEVIRQMLIYLQMIEPEGNLFSSISAIS